MKFSCQGIKEWGLAHQNDWLSGLPSAPNN